MTKPTPSRPLAAPTGGVHEPVACLLRAGQKQRACIAASPCFVWCRHQESNPGPTDYKQAALYINFNELDGFLLRDR